MAGWRRHCYTSDAKFQPARHAVYCCSPHQVPWESKQSIHGRRNHGVLLTTGVEVRVHPFYLPTKSIVCRSWSYTQVLLPYDTAHSAWSKCCIKHPVHAQTQAPTQASVAATYTCHGDRDPNTLAEGAFVRHGCGCDSQDLTQHTILTSGYWAEISWKWSTAGPM